MADEGKQTLTRIKNNQKTHDLLIELLYRKTELESKDAEFLYSVALSLISEYEKNKEKSLFIEYAYYIISKTSMKIGDYRALYDFSVNYGYYPISRKIIDLNLISDLSINHVLSEISIDDFSDDNKIKTYEQNKIFNDVLSDDSNSTSFLAPTSYGKSELIFRHLKQYDAMMVGIIVPTKALIDQVSRDAKNIISDRKIIVHDQTYNPENDNRILAVVTQERALRLIEGGIVFDTLYIDEAHELLDFDFGRRQNNRSLLLARLIRINQIKNPNTKQIFLSPAVQKSNSLQIIKGNTISEHKINNDLKLLDIQFVDRECKVYKYDKYLGEMIDLGNVSGYQNYVRSVSKNKNLHFLYRPKFIEQYTDQLFQTLNKINPTEDIKRLIDELKEIVHPEFKLAKYLEKGIIYLHGRLPISIRNYLMKFVKESKDVKHFVANSIVLAGMNLPIDNLFYISGFAKTKDLYNLIGRVNRLNEIFSPNNIDLSKIMIPIHFLEIDDFPQYHNGNMMRKIESLRGKFDDEIKNPLLINSVINKSNQEKADEIRISENNIVENYSNPNFKEKLTIAGAQQILNYTNLGLKKLESSLLSIEKISNIEILDLVKIIFFDSLEYNVDFNPEFNALRLQWDETINYYKMFISDLKTRSLKDRINKIVTYWKKIEDPNYKIYVDRSFGEVTFDSENYPDSTNKVYVKLSDHISDDSYLYNLALVKLQIDEDYLGHEITLLVNTLLKFDVISQVQFDEFFFGTTDEKELEILQLGISRTIFKKLSEENQIENIVFDRFGNAKANEELKIFISDQKGIEKFELEQYFI